ncbi:LexA/Signal peptidase [Periconia macrospinosa]|uniref:Mitochondrial inner membrane protease subunit n=1 Tax=Periconia macrospinosa TaxID=97972 RepID=A0A2V1E534_9PLEO|nr:LexA/Signal peptidase [Periconia macrospinosa]
MPLPRIRPTLFARLRAATSLKYVPPHHQSTALGQFTWAFNLYIFGHIFFSYVGGISATSGISMVPTIPPDVISQPWVIYSKWYRRGRDIKVGDVVTFKTPSKPKQDACKRVIGMPGDYVSVVSPGREAEDLGKKPEEGDWANVKSEVFRVPEGHCWVQGDNLEWSRDSRMYGPVPLALVQSKVLGYFTWGQLKWFKNGLEDTKNE